VTEIDERHRQRYEFNKRYATQLQSRGLVLSGKCVGRELVEIIELPDHPWFLAVQFHPELRSRPHEPHPLFVDFVRAALERRRARLGHDDFGPVDPPPPSEERLLAEDTALRMPSSHGLSPKSPASRST